MVVVHLHHAGHAIIHVGLEILARNRLRLRVVLQFSAPMHKNSSSSVVIAVEYNSKVGLSPSIDTIVQINVYVVYSI